MDDLRRLVCGCATVLVLGTTLVASSFQPQDDKAAKEGDRRPKISLKANPVASMAPSRVVLTADLIGGANDFEEYYCPTIEWDWGDGTRSESGNDCDPYEMGKSEIKRRFTVAHVFQAGSWRVLFRLKRSAQVVATVSVNIQVRPGI